MSAKFKRTVGRPINGGFAFHMATYILVVKSRAAIWVWPDPISTHGLQCATAVPVLMHYTWANLQPAEMLEGYIRSIAGLESAHCSWKA